MTGSADPSHELSYDEGREKNSNKKITVEHIQDFADKFNLSVSEIAKHDLSYQDLSILGYDGLLKEDQLNNKIKLLEEKIERLEVEVSTKDIAKANTKAEQDELQEQP